MNSVGFMQKWDTLGALCASGAFLWRVNRSPYYWMRVAADEPAARRKMVRTKEPLVQTTVEVLLELPGTVPVFTGLLGDSPRVKWGLSPVGDCSLRLEI